jgi:hypothetical protein
MDNAISPAALVVVCYACCGDPDLKPRCKRCGGTGADPNPGPDPRIGRLEAEQARLRREMDGVLSTFRALGAAPFPAPGRPALSLIPGGAA